MVEADPVQLVLRLHVLLLGAARQHDRAVAVDQPADPGAEGLARQQSDAEAARDVAAVVIDAGADVHHRRAGVHQARHLVGSEALGRRRHAADERRAALVQRPHVGVVGRITMLVENAGQKLHDLGGQKVRVGQPLLAEGGLVPGPAADAAERAAAVGGVNGDVVRQAS